MKCSTVVWRFWWIGVAAIVLAGAVRSGAPAQAQYASGFSYYNPRSGFGYSQGWSMGRHSYAGGFSVVTPRYGFSSYNGFGPGQSFGGMQYVNRRHFYSHGWDIGRRASAIRGSSNAGIVERNYH